MSELQAEAAEESDVIIEDESEEQAQPESSPEANIEDGADLATAEPEEAEKSTQDSESVQKAINRQHRKYREEERKRLEVEQELREAREKLTKFEQVDADVTIPPMPDAWDDDFESKLKARDHAIQRKAESDARKQFAEDQAFRAQQDEQLKIQRDTQEKLESYAKRAGEAGIKEADLATAANRVADAGISPEVADFLLTDVDGPVITAYLADERNTLELFELAQMSPVMVGMKLTEIRAKAAEMKQPTTSTPPPPETVSGRGKVENVSPFVAGAKFE